MEKVNLIEEIINKIPEGIETDLEKAYFIYVETCKIFKYDIRYHDSPELIQFAIAHNNQDIKRIYSKDIICGTWSKIYMKLLKKVGIDSKLVERRGHSWVEFKADDLLMYCDPTYGLYTDLSRIKHNGFPAHFFPITGEETEKLPIRNININFDYILENINKKIGYKVTEDKLLDELKDEVKSFNNITDKVQYVIQAIDLTRHDLASDTEYLFNAIRRTLDKESGDVHFATIKKYDEYYNLDMVKIIRVKDEDNYYYYLFEKIDDIELVEKQDILEYVDKGYGIEKNHKDIGFDYPLKFTVPKANLKYFNHITRLNKKEEIKEKGIKK